LFIPDGAFWVIKRTKEASVMGIKHLKNEEKKMATQKMWKKNQYLEEGSKGRKKLFKISISLRYFYIFCQ